MLFKKKVYRKKVVRKRKVIKRSNIRKIAKQAVLSLAEKKVVSYTVSNLPISNYVVGAYAGTANSLSTYYLTPNTNYLVIAHGNTQAGRIGNKIRLNKVTLRMVLYANIYNATLTIAPRPCEVILYVGYQKNSANGAPDIGYPSFYQSGSSSVVPTGNLSDIIRSVNKDYYRIVATKRYKIGNSFWNGTTALVTPGDYGDFANNDYKMNKTIMMDLTKHCVKDVIYNDNNTEPTTRGLFFWIEAVTANGTAMNAGNYPISATFQIENTFTDL
mgnify:CR=1 FL=1